MPIKKIKIIVKNGKTRDGREFKYFRAVQKDGTLIDCRFRKEVDPPEETCYIQAYSTDLNIDHKKEYPVLWVRAIQSIDPIRAEGEVDAEIDDRF